MRKSIKDSCIICLICGHPHMYVVYENKIIFNNVVSKVIEDYEESKNTQDNKIMIINQVPVNYELLESMKADNPRIVMVSGGGASRDDFDTLSLDSLDHL